jgi:N utilization substance protein B
MTDPATTSTPTPREIRRLAFQALFQLDIHEGSDVTGLQHTLGQESGMTAARIDSAFKLAIAAFVDRKAADAMMTRLAPNWPAYRQATVDRAILRLAHYELTHNLGPGAVIINDAVGLAQEFSTDKSPAFVNALLDKAWKNIQPQTPQT